mmetsp:Transcript_117/g.123  ORF Transcript_117/g.123 Transcript_117/m.123 type:complete len:1045 (-) Transcript_117:269-3403(-)|eukprot:CAMPEP_0117764220 /NCGR_PEP_ID=MMETSP0947-20121206/19233_1 /TAXON_ID=44440 /ORGANISM="Chattonella subsalsa, Strain CCMP2191" /LENGTH=1044 /DNA_ID=CAMNT_0005586335 /DNA_START=239 /DNA_END=3373 /DNA_ORIENTATION=-
MQKMKLSLRRSIFQFIVCYLFVESSIRVLGDLNEAPLAPVSISAISVIPTTAVVQYTLSSDSSIEDILYFTLYYQLISSSGSDEQSIHGLVGTTATLTGLAPYSHYKVWVSATNAGGESPRSPMDTFKTGVLECPDADGSEQMVFGNIDGYNSAGSDGSEQLTVVVPYTTTYHQNIDKVEFRFGEDECESCSVSVSSSSTDTTCAKVFESPCNDQWNLARLDLPMSLGYPCGFHEAEVDEASNELVYTVDFMYKVYYVVESLFGGTEGLENSEELTTAIHITWPRTVSVTLSLLEISELPLQAAFPTSFLDMKDQTQKISISVETEMPYRTSEAYLSEGSSGGRRLETMVPLTIEGTEGCEEESPGEYCLHTLETPDLESPSACGTESLFFVSLTMSSCEDVSFDCETVDGEITFQVPDNFCASYLGSPSAYSGDVQGFLKTYSTVVAGGPTGLEVDSEASAFSYLDTINYELTMVGEIPEKGFSLVSFTIVHVEDSSELQFEINYDGTEPVYSSENGHATPTIVVLKPFGDTNSMIFKHNANEYTLPQYSVDDSFSSVSFSNYFVYCVVSLEGPMVDQRNLRAELSQRHLTGSVVQATASLSVASPFTNSMYQDQITDNTLDLEKGYEECLEILIPVVVVGVALSCLLGWLWHKKSKKIKKSFKSLPRFGKVPVVAEKGAFIPVRGKLFGKDRDSPSIFRNLIGNHTPSHTPPALHNEIAPEERFSFIKTEKVEERVSLRDSDVFAEERASLMEEGLIAEFQDDPVECCCPTSIRSLVGCHHFETSLVDPKVSKVPGEGAFAKKKTQESLENKAKSASKALTNSHRNALQFDDQECAVLETGFNIPLQQGVTVEDTFSFHREIIKDVVFEIIQAIELQEKRIIKSRTRQSSTGMYRSERHQRPRNKPALLKLDPERNDLSARRQSDCGLDLMLSCFACFGAEEDILFNEEPELPRVPKKRTSITIKPKLKVKMSEKVIDTSNNTFEESISSPLEVSSSDVPNVVTGSGSPLNSAYPDEVISESMLDSFGFQTAGDFEQYPSLN